MKILFYCVCLCGVVCLCMCLCEILFSICVYLCPWVHVFVCLCMCTYACFVSEGIYIPLCVCVYRSGDSLECGAPSTFFETGSCAVGHCSCSCPTSIYKHRGMLESAFTVSAGMLGWQMCFPVSAGRCSGDLTQVLRLEPPPYAKRGFRMVVLCPVLSNMGHTREIR